MKKKPMLLNILAVLYFGMAASIPLQIMYLYGHGLQDHQLIFHKISLFNWLVMGCSFFNAYALYKAKSYLKFTIPINLLIVTINNWFVSSVGVDYTHMQTQIATISLTLLTSLLVFSKAMNVLENPRLNWWSWAKRIKKQIPVTVIFNNEELYKTNTFDLSRSGAYLEYHENSLSSSEKKTKILKGETVELIIGKTNSFRCKALVVRKMAGDKGNYPRGIGVSFKSISFTNMLPLFKLLYSNGNQSHGLSQ